MRNGALLIAVFSLAVLGSSEPARFQSGTLFSHLPMTAGGGEVLLELEVTASGTVSEATLLRTTPPFGELLREAVRGWRFTSARDVAKDRETSLPVDSRVLVAGLFWPPYLEPPEDLGLPSTEVPFPTTIVAPLHPVTAQLRTSGLVLIEVEVGAQGEVAATRVIQEAEGLNAAALEAAGKWRFRPAQRKGKAVASVAYIVFGFREPVVSD